MSEHPLVGAVIRGPVARRPNPHPEYVVEYVAVEDNGYGVLVEFAGLRRINGTYAGTRSRIATAALDRYRVIGRAKGAGWDSR